jgi:hypothetical protein
VKLVPNYFIGVSKVAILIAIAEGITAYWNYLDKGTWLPVDDWLSLLIALFVVPIIVCLMFVPQYINVDKDGFEIKYFLRTHRYILFNDIRAFGYGKNVFRVQPNTGSTLQIYSGCFLRKTWTPFVDMLNAKCPGKKAWLWIGVWGIRQKWK